MIYFCILLFSTGVAVSRAGDTPVDAAVVTPGRPRDAASFTALFAKSPFIMPSAGEQSAISQRYVITGTVKIGNEARIFLLDQTSQKRLMISASQPEGNVSLVSLQPNADPSKVRATIRVGSDVGVVTFGTAQSPAPNTAAKNPNPASAAAQLASNAQALSVLSTNSPGNGLSPTPVRKLIRKNVIPLPTKTIPQQQISTP